MRLCTCRPPTLPPQTLKWCKFDFEKREAAIQVFGGFGGTRGSQGLWTAPPTCSSAVATNTLRACNLTYVLRFSNDWRRADVDVRCNGCCCVPCLPPCLSLPPSCLRSELRQTKRSHDGSEWERDSAVCGGELQLQYMLRVAIDETGRRGKYPMSLKDAPPLVFMTR